MNWKLGCSLLVFLVVFLVLLPSMLFNIFPSLTYVKCSRYEAKGSFLETICTKQYPFPWKFSGKIVANKREGFGTEQTSDWQYKGEFVNDKKNGQGKIQLFSSTFETFEGTIEGIFEDNYINTMGKITLFLNSSYHASYEGGITNSLLNGHGELKGYKNGNPFFTLSNDHENWKGSSIFQEGKIIGEESNGVIGYLKVNISKHKEVDIELLRYENKWNFPKGFENEGILKMNIFKDSKKSILFAWNGKDLSFIEGMSHENEEEIEDDLKNMNFDFVSEMVREPLRLVLNILRDFELFFLTKDISLRDQFDLYAQLELQGEEISLKKEDKELIENMEL